MPPFLTARNKIHILRQLRQLRLASNENLFIVLQLALTRSGPNSKVRPDDLEGEVFLHVIQSLSGKYVRACQFRNQFSERSITSASDIMFNEAHRKQLSSGGKKKKKKKKIACYSGEWFVSFPGVGTKNRSKITNCKERERGKDLHLHLLCCFCFVLFCFI